MLTKLFSFLSQHFLKHDPFHHSMLLCIQNQQFKLMTCCCYHTLTKIGKTNSLKSPANNDVSNSAGHSIEDAGTTRMTIAEQQNFKNGAEARDVKSNKSQLVSLLLKQHLFQLNCIILTIMQIISLILLKVTESMRIGINIRIRLNNFTMMRKFS